MKTDRRSFLIQTAFAASGIAMGQFPPLAINHGSITKKNEAYNDLNKNKISVFSKNLHWLNYSDMANEVKNMGFDGIDLTVRPAGHVLPERVKEDLPIAVNIIREKGLEVYSITTGILNADDAFTEDILKTASEHGIKNYRMGWYPYEKSSSIHIDLEKIKTRLKSVEQINKKYRIHGDYQNHAGEWFGAPVLDLYMVFKELDPLWIGCQYDIRHSTVEGAHSWPIGFELIIDYIKSINLKDFQWTRKEGKWVEENVPLGTGMVDFKKYFEYLKMIHFDGPICIHYEYPLGGAEDGAFKISIPKDEALGMMQRDLKKARRMIADV